MKHITFILILVLLAFSCDEIAPSEPKFIIEGFVFAGEPINDIVIKAQTSIQENDSVKRIISNATVFITKNDIRYELEYKNGKYRDINGDIDVQSGDLLLIEATVQDRTAHATTVVPPATSGLSISDSQMAIPEIRLGFSLQQQLTQLFFDVRLTARWNNPEEDLHFIVIEPVVNEFDSIFPTDFPQNGRDFLSSFKFAPSAIETDTFSIIGIAFETYGRHRAKVYRVNQEYADLFNAPTQDSRDLTRPPSNVINGFGIFSAFAADSVFFDIVRE